MQLLISSVRSWPIRRGILSHLCRRGFSFDKVPRRSYCLRAVCRKNPRRLHPDARGHASDENPFAMQIDPSQDIVCS
jgi:hypothetical protein